MDLSVVVTVHNNHSFTYTLFIKFKRFCGAAAPSSPHHVRLCSHARFCWGSVFELLFESVNVDEILWLILYLCCSEKDRLLPSRDEALRLKSLLQNCTVRNFKANGHAILLVCENKLVICACVWMLVQGFVIVACSYLILSEIFKIRWAPGHVKDFNALLIWCRAQPISVYVKNSYVLYISSVIS
jgi:hypothetical protein